MGFREIPRPEEGVLHVPEVEDELTTQDHRAIIINDRRRGYRKWILGALAAIITIAAIPRSNEHSLHPHMSEWWEEHDDKWGVDREEARWREELQKMAEEDKYNELNVAEFFEKLQRLAWGINNKSLEKGSEKLNKIIAHLEILKSDGRSKKDVYRALAGDIHKEHSEEQNSSAYLLTHEKILGENGGNCFARFAKDVSVLTELYPEDAQYMRMDLRKWREYGRWKAHVALYIDARAFDPNLLPNQEWYILDRGTLIKARKGPSHPYTPLKEALIKSFLEPKANWGYLKGIWIPTDKEAPPEHTIPATLYHEDEILNSSNGQTNYSMLERGRSYLFFQGKVNPENDNDEGVRYFEEMTVIKVTVDEDGEITEEIVGKNVMVGGPKIRACYDTAWELIKTHDVSTSTTLQIVEGQTITDVTLQGFGAELEDAYRPKVVGESVNDPNLILGTMLFGELTGFQQEKKFRCRVTDTGEERDVARPTGHRMWEHEGFSFEATTTWEVEEFALESTPEEIFPQVGCPIPSTPQSEEDSNPLGVEMILPTR